MDRQCWRAFLLGAVLLAVLAVQPTPVAGEFSIVDLCEEFENATLCACHKVHDTLVHLTCDGNATYSGDIPDFSELERHNLTLFLTILRRHLPTFDTTFLDRHPLLQTVTLQENGLRELVGTLSHPRQMQSLIIKDNFLSSIGDLALNRLEVDVLDLTNNSFTAVPSVALGHMGKVNRLFLSNNPLTHLPRNAFNKTTLEYLKLQSCLVSSIAEGAFRGMYDLSTLELDNNELTRVEKHYFTDLARTPRGINALKILSLTHNKIEDIVPGSFNFSQLKTLHIHHNRLRRLRSGVFLFSHDFDNLDFSYNALEHIEEGALDDVHVIEGNVDFSNNQLTRIEAHYFRNLVFDENHDNPKPTLNLAYNMIEYIAPEAFDVFKGLYELKLNSNRLQNVSATLLRPSLVLVNMNDNLLTRIPNGSMRALTEWKLEGNHITHVGADDLKPYLALMSLHLSNNTELDHFHEDALKCVSELQVVECDHCRLKKLPNFSHNPKLADIMFQYNQITAVPDDLCVGKESLAEISLAFNQLTVFPNVTQCPFMDGLVVAGNMITVIPDDALKGLRHLRILSIDYNQITELPPNLLKGRDCFEEFTAGHNLISEIPEGFFDEAHNLENLNLEHNRLTRLQRDVFTNLTYIHKLLLGHNQIAHIDENAWRNGSFHFMTELDLSYNPFPRLPAPGEGFPHLQVLSLVGCPNLLVVPLPNATKRIERVHYTYPYHCCLWAGGLLPDWRSPERDDYDPIPRYGVDSYTVATTMPPTQAPPPPMPDPTGYPHPPVSPYPDGGFGIDDILNFFSSINPFGGGSISTGNITFDINGAPKIKVNCKTRVHPTSKLDDLRCFPRYNEFTPCEDLLGSWALRVLVWAVVILALSGNAAVLFVMVASKKTMDTPQFLISNLAFADLILGIYLAFISVVDLQTHGSQAFYLSAVTWQLGAGCKTAGFLAIFATELSVYLLVVITFERLYTFTYAMQNKRLELRPAIVLVVIGWVCAFAIAILPILPFGINSYSTVAVCLPFEVDSIGGKLFIGGLVIVNLIGLVMVVAFYMRIYCVLRRSSAANSATQDRKLIRSILLLTVVDFLCWAPLSFLTLSAIFGLDLINTSASKWFVVLVFPINACCNPFLYAIFTKKFRQRVQETLCCGTKQGALQRPPYPGQSTQRLSARRNSIAISIAEMNRRVSSSSVEYSTPFRGRLNSTQPLLHQLSSSGAPSSLLSSSDRTSITSIGSSSMPSVVYGRRSSLPSTLAGPHPLEQSKEGQSQSLCCSPTKGITSELYHRMLPTLLAHSPNCSGSLPNLPEGCSHDFESPLPSTGSQLDGSPNSYLHVSPPYRTISPGEYHMTNLATVQEASNENLQSQPSASLDSNPWGGSGDESEPLTFEEMKPLSKSVFDALQSSEYCVEGEDAVCGGTPQGEAKDQPSPHSVGVWSGEGEEEGTVDMSNALSISAEANSSRTQADSASEGGHSMKSLEELSKSPWTPARKQSGSQGHSPKPPQNESGTSHNKMAGVKYSVVAVNPRFQSEVIGPETEV